MASPYTVRDLSDDRQIVPVLEQDRIWSAYALCDVDIPYRQNARFIGSLRDGEPTAVFLLYNLPHFISVVPSGETKGIAKILQLEPSLPEALFLSIREGHFPAIEQRYRIERSWTMLRMAIKEEQLLEPPRSLPVTRLGPEALPAIEQLYTLYPSNVFDVSMLRHGIYFGGYENSELIAIGGTHTVSHRFRLATIGGVLTHPDHRGRGWATAVTWNLAKHLFAEGIRDIVLNVGEDNQAALGAYRRLGFASHCRFYEGHARLK